jgi:hypothetical protein
LGNNDDVGEFNENLDDVEMDAAAGERAMESAGVNDFSDLLRNRICEPDDHDRKVVQIQTFHPNLITHSRWKNQGVVEFIPTLHPKLPSKTQNSMKIKEENRLQNLLRDGKRCAELPAITKATTSLRDGQAKPQWIPFLPRWLGGGW